MYFTSKELNDTSSSRSMSRWLGPRSGKEAKDEKAQPGYSKWSFGVLNDKEAGEVPGSVLFLAASHNEPLGLRNVHARTSQLSIPAEFSVAMPMSPVSSRPAPQPPSLATQASEFELDDHESRKLTENGDIVLEPQPEDSANDPLNWPGWRRDAALLSLGFYCMIGGGITSILAAGFTNIADTYDVSIDSVSLTVGLYMMGLGLGSAVASPTAILFGKRPVYLASVIMFIGTCVWAAKSPSFGSLVAARVFQGIAVSPVECLPSATIAEIFFLHERAYRIGIYTLLLLGGKNIIPLVSASIIERFGWRWVFYIVAMVSALAFFLLFLFTPETFWDRTPTRKPSKPPSLLRHLPSRHNVLARRQSVASSETAKMADRPQSTNAAEPRTAFHVSFPTSICQPEQTSRQEYPSQASLVQSLAHLSVSPDLDVGFPTASESEKHHGRSAMEAAKVRSSSIREVEDERGSHNHGNAESAVLDTHFELMHPPDELPYDNTDSLCSSLRTPSASSAKPPQDEHHLYSSYAHSTTGIDANVNNSRGSICDNKGVQGSSLRGIPEVKEYTHNLRQHPPKTFTQRLKPYHGRLNNDKWLKVMLRPFILYSHPAVLWSAIVYSCSIGWLIIISETIAIIYRDPSTYNFTALQTGLIYISPFIGGVFGTVIAGRISDIIVQAMARRNGGLYEPEFRLVMAIPITLTTCIGLIGFGWSAQEKDHWIVPTAFFGILSFGCSLGSTTSITFCVDSYRQYAGEALVTLNFSKNVLHGLVFSLFISNWMAYNGPKNVYMWLGIIQLIFQLTTIPLFIYGKRARMWTARKNFMNKF